MLEAHAPAHGLGELGGNRRIGHDLALVEQGEHALRCSERALEHVHGEGELRERLGRLHDVLEERLEACPR